MSFRKPVKFGVIQLLAVSSLLATGVASRADEPGCQGIDAQALQLMDKMSRSLRQVSYQGVVILQRGDDMQSMQVSHTVGEGVSSERLTELTGQGAQVERDAHALNCVHPGYRMLRIESLPDSERCGISEQYRFSIADGERVAGRNAVRIRIEPRDRYRYGYVLALDSETGLLLKSQTISHGHETLETMQFAHLTYTDTVPSASQVAAIHQAEHPQTDHVDGSTAVALDWTVRWLPRGFVATDSPAGNVGRRTYTDGLAVFSIFLEAPEVDIVPGEGMVRQGGTTIYTRGMQLAGRPALVTVIGEVPGETARKVVESVNWTE